MLKICFDRQDDKHSAMVSFGALKPASRRQVGTSGMWCLN